MLMSSVLVRKAQVPNGDGKMTYPSFTGATSALITRSWSGSRTTSHVRMRDTPNADADDYC